MDCIKEVEGARCSTETGVEEVKGVDCAREVEGAGVINET